jgi:glycosyltransferase involved in cell wall biosynthesis
MKILYITPNTPIRLKYGAGMRNEAIFKYLCSHHEVHLALVPFDSVKPVEYHTKFGPLLPVHDMFVFTSKDGFVNANQQVFSLDGLIKIVKPDILWAFEKWTIRKIGFPKSIPTILDLVDVQWHKHWQTIKHINGGEKITTGFKLVRSIIEDNFFATRAHRVIIANAQEKKYLLGKNKVVPIPNGHTFPTEFQFRNNADQKLSFFGSLFYYPNLNGLEWFFKYVWPIISDRLPQASIDILGDISTLGGSLDEMRKIRGVHIHGFVEEIDPWIAKSSALVVPLLIGGGTRIKIIEAWAKGLPVVSTSIGCEGLGGRDGDTILVADRPIEFADACLSLLNEPEKRQKIAVSAYKWSKNIFDWETVLARIPNLLGNL